MVHERCLKCDHYNHSVQKCTRVLKGRIHLAFEGRLTGEMDFTTQPGMLTKALEDDLAEFLSHYIPELVERWRGWAEVAKAFEGEKECAAEAPNKCVREFGIRVLTPYKPVVDESTKEDDIPGYQKTEGYSGF